MRSKCPSRIAAILLFFALTAGTAGAWPWRHRQGIKIKVRFLASSTFIRGTWGWNEDTYLAQLLLPRQNETVLVRLVDAYPNEWPPLSHAILMSDTGTFLAVKRDAECDQPFGEILLRTAPGDLMAILPVRLSYRPPLKQTPALETMLPCYRILQR